MDSKTNTKKSTLRYNWLLKQTPEETQNRHTLGYEWWHRSPQPCQNKHNKLGHSYIKKYRQTFSDQRIGKKGGGGSSKPHNEVVLCFFYYYFIILQLLNMGCEPWSISHLTGQLMLLGYNVIFYLSKYSIKEVKVP